MAVYYVATTGAAGNPGTFAQPKDTVANGLALLTTKGDKLRVLNTGTYTLNAVDNDVLVTTGAGTDFDTDPGYTIEGWAADDSGPDLVTVNAPAAGNGTFVFFRAGSGYNIVRGFKANFQPSVADATVQQFVLLRDAGVGPVRIEYCHYIGTTGTSLPTASKRLLNFQTTAPTYMGEVRYCLIVQPTSSGIVFGGGGASQRIALHHNVVYFTLQASSPAAATMGAFAGAASDVRWYNNTIYYVVPTNNTLSGWVNYQVGAGDVGRLDIYSNLVYLNTASVAVTKVSNGVYDGNNAGTATPSSGTRSHNVLLTALAQVDFSAEGVYSVSPFDAGVDDAYDNDVQSFGVAASTLFFNTAATYDWDANSSGYVLTLPADLRPISQLTSGLGGTVPGALPAASTDYVVTTTTDLSSPEEGEVVTLTVTVSNSASGTNATGVEVTSAIPAGLTFVSATPSVGSFVAATGVWTVGALVAGGSATLVLVVTVNSGQSGNNIVFTATLTDGDPSAGAPTGDDTDSLTLSVLDTSDPSTPGGSGEIPYLDVLPILFPDLRMQFNVRLSTNINRVVRHYIRADVERRRWREFTMRCIIVAANTTLTVNLGGIQRARNLFMEATSAVRLSRTDTGSTFLPAATALALVGGDFETIRIQNPSLTSASTVILVAVD